MADCSTVFSHKHFAIWHLESGDLVDPQTPILGHVLLFHTHTHTHTPTHTQSLYNILKWTKRERGTCCLGGRNFVCWVHSHHHPAQSLKFLGKSNLGMNEGEGKDLIFLFKCMAG